jgi:rhodanese-related sulfurtransferase
LYRKISQEKAKEIMDTEDVIVLDVRTSMEYEVAHIPGAILIPYTDLAELAPCTLPDKAMPVLLYCRSGRRTIVASNILTELGYTNVRDFGGIIDWPYQIHSKLHLD